MNVYCFLKQSGKSPFLEYLDTVSDQRELAAIESVIEALAESKGRLPYPLCRVY